MMPWWAWLVVVLASVLLTIGLLTLADVAWDVLVIAWRLAVAAWRWMTLTESERAWDAVPRGPVTAGDVVLNRGLEEHLRRLHEVDLIEVAPRGPVAIEGDPAPALGCGWCKPADRVAVLDARCKCTRQCGHPMCTAQGEAS